MVIQATQQIDVKLDKEQSRIVARDYLLASADWKDTYFVRDGWVYNNKMCHTSHAFEIEEKVRLATEEDKALANIFEKHYFNL